MSYTIVNHSGVDVLRDDLYPGGTKARFAVDFLGETSYIEYVYAGTAQGAAIVALGYAGAMTQKPVIIFIAERSQPNDIMQEALDAGKGFLKFKYVPMGFYPKIKSACKQYCQPDLYREDIRYNIPCGIDLPGAVEKIALLAVTIRSDYGIYDVVFSACSSGTLQRGLQKGELGKKYYAIATGQKNIKPGIAKVIKHYDIQSFTQLVKKDKRPPFPSVLNYDAKVWQYAYEFKQNNPEKKVLMWNVWGNPDQRKLFGTNEDYNRQIA